MQAASLRSSLLAIAVFLVSGGAFADQFVAMDETWVHGPDMPDSHYRVSPMNGTPEDWSRYADGTAWVYLEVHSKPTAQETKFQVCFEATPTYACTNQSPTYTTVGTYEWETPFANFWSPPNTSVDWSQGTNKLACILKDTMNGKPSADNVGAETAALYMPTEVRMVVTIVENGSTYIPPQPTGEGGAGGTGGQGTGGAASSGGSSAGGTSAGGSSNGSGGETAGGADSGGAGGANETDEGCSLSTTQARGGGLWMMTAMALLAARARRRSPSTGARAT